MAIVLAGTGVYIYERYYRVPSDNVLVGTWQMEDNCIDCTHWVTLQPNHSVVGFSESLGRIWLDYHGRWYAGGQVLVIRYDPPDEAQSMIMRILDIGPDTIRVRWSGHEMRLTRSGAVPPQASNQAMKRIAAGAKIIL